MAKAREGSTGQSPAKRARSRVAAPTAETAELAADLSYGEALTALELTLAQLQASDVDVEAMVGLYRRGEAYANRCEALLQQLQQEVSLWSSDDPDSTPTPFKP